MPTLPELQHAMRRTVLGAPDDILPAAVLGDGLEPTARLRLYGNHVMTSLSGALGATFPVVRRLVGADFFAGLARAFVSRHPPVSPCLFEYGGELADFIAAYAPAATLPYLADVARLEWAMNHAYHGEVEPPLDASALAALAPDTLAAVRFRLQPATHVVQSIWPIDAIWRANQAESDGGGVVLGEGGRTVLVWRQGDDAVFRRLDPAMAVFVAALADGATLSGAADQAIVRGGEFDLAAALQLLLGHGLVTGLRS